MSTTHLYHATDFGSLCNIINSKAFWPSYCYERAEYLKNPMNFAFAMVCFADLLDVEVKKHLNKFNKDCYIQMNRDWALRNHLSNVIYYNRQSVTAASFRRLVDGFIDNLEIKREENPRGFIEINLLMAFFKQYEGYYWNDNISKWSSKRTIFYTEREWRYIPLVQDYEAYYLESDEFLNKEIRSAKRDELIKKGYVLKFSWNDIDSIGVRGLKRWLKLCWSLTREYSLLDVLRKLKLIGFMSNFDR